MNTSKYRLTTGRTALTLVAGFVAATGGYAGAINVPDGNFSLLSGVGAVGGGLIAQSGSALIGTGPWTGTYNAVANVLLPPALVINATGGQPSGGRATILGIIASSGILSPIVNNGGLFSQTLGGVAYQANTTYTLSANIDPGALLNAGVLSLNNFGVGIALTNGGALLADTSNSSYFLSLALLSNTNYQLQLTYTTGAVAPVGDLGIRLYDTPNGVAQANLLNSVSFSNVTLDASTASATPEPGTCIMLFLGCGLCGVARVFKKKPAGDLLAKD